eukprot:365673-Chlamydomonas_euryale.AAC.4
MPALTHVRAGPWGSRPPTSHACLRWTLGVESTHVVDHLLTPTTNEQAVATLCRPPSPVLYTRRFTAGSPCVGPGHPFNRSVNVVLYVNCSSRRCRLHRQGRPLFPSPAALLPPSPSPPPLVLNTAFAGPHTDSKPLLLNPLWPCTALAEPPVVLSCLCSTNFASELPLINLL